MQCHGKRLINFPFHHKVCFFWTDEEGNTQ
jgi:hypothetical protein